MKISFSGGFVQAGAVLWLLTLSACSISPPVKIGGGYSRLALEHSLAQGPWSLQGRMSLTGADDSWSADVFWQHEPELEQIRLSGPLGQGAVSIRLEDGFVAIARGDQAVETSDQPELFIRQQLGLNVPVQSLRYWVLGLPSPDQNFEDSLTGFSQGGWLIEYLQMQEVQGYSVPHKIFVKNPDVKLKLIIDQWTINGKKTQ